jgi:RHS repeat-associated protein
LPYRKGGEGDYRYGFQGQERDDEIKGAGNSLNYEYRMHDPRLGRFFAVDKAFRQYPELSSYAFIANSPIQYKEKDGRVIVDPNGKVVFMKIGTTKIGHEGAPGKLAEVNYGFVFGNDGTPILVYEDVLGQIEGLNTNCHGVAYAKGEYWIDNEQVPSLLIADGYSEQNYEDRKWGDVAVYTDNSDNVEDSKKGCENHDLVYGQGGLETKNTKKPIDEAWSDQKSTKKLRIYRKPKSGDVTYSEDQIKDLKERTMKDVKSALKEANSKKPKLAKSTKKTHIVPKS